MPRIKHVLLLSILVSCCLLLLTLHDHLHHTGAEKNDGRVLPDPVSHYYRDNLMQHAPKNVNQTSGLTRGRRVSLPRHKHRQFHSHEETGSVFKHHFRKDLFYNSSTMPVEFKKWNEYKDVFCDGQVIGFQHEFAYIKDVIIDKNFCTCKLKGGESVDAVINQAEEEEYYKFEMGCFKRRCGLRPKYFFNGENHLNDWLFSMSTHDMNTYTSLEVHDQFTIAITRYEYANLYHTMTDWYNAFLLMQYFNHTQYDTNILFIDAHPYSSLDSTWNYLFNSTARLSALTQITYFRHLVWGWIGYNSLMTSYISGYPPLYEEFREFFLSSFQVNTSRQLDCKHLSIRFLWRHNYLAHPRNPSGNVSRKIGNEQELIRYVKLHNEEAHVSGLQIDQFDMRQQLNYIVNTDILVAMHGAGLTHALFLPKWAAVIELIPYYWQASSEHFQAISFWRHLVYEKWINTDPHSEIPNQSTVVPPSIVNALIKNAMRRICGNFTASFASNV